MKPESKIFEHTTPVQKLDNDLEVKQANGQRFYKSPNGEFLPSVTTVTGWAKRDFFAGWRANNQKESKRVLSRGNDFHDIIERYLQNKEDYILPEHSKMSEMLFEQMRPILHNIDEINAQESALWGEIVPLAGRLDCLAKYNGKLSIIDFKASTKVKRKQDIHNYFMQATAYALMWEERTGQKIENFAILISCEGGEVQVFEGNPIDYVKDLFNCITEYYLDVTSQASP